MSNIDWTQRKVAPTASELLKVAKDSLKARATEIRWKRETGGVMFEGLLVLTGIEDQNRISTIAANASRSGIDSVDFKAANGWHSVTVAQVEAVACAVALHVQACFTAERLHHEAIDLLKSIEAVQAYDLGGGWPPTAESGPSATP